MFLNATIDQQLDRPVATWACTPSEEESHELREWVLGNVRGTVQADILKEDQGRNT